MSKKVLFLLSTERSGSTFFIHLMNAHSQVFAPPTSHLIRILYNNIHRYGDLSKNGDVLIQDVKDVLSNMLGEWNVSMDDLRLSIDDCKTLNYTLKTLIEQIYYPTSGEKPNILIKENYSWQFFPFLRDEMGIKKFIHLVRDPRDVALSWKKSPNHPGGVKAAAARWKEDQEEFLKIDQRWGNVYRLAYERLINEPSEQLKRLFEYLDITFEDSILAYHQSKTTQKNAARLQNWANIAKPVIPDNSGKFAQGLTKDEISYIEYHCQDMMKTLGYDLTTDFEFNEENIIEPENKASLLSPEEKTIRDNRLAVIQRIISRDLS